MAQQPLYPRLSLHWDCSSRAVKPKSNLPVDQLAFSCPVSRLQLISPKSHTLEIRPIPWNLLLFTLQSKPASQVNWPAVPETMMTAGSEKCVPALSVSLHLCRLYWCVSSVLNHAAYHTGELSAS